MTFIGVLVAVRTPPGPVLPYEPSLDSVPPPPRSFHVGRRAQRSLGSSWGLQKRMRVGA